jgi:1-deoxy-D-xylulose-5-phosphate reductoisomerase
MPSAPFKRKRVVLLGATGSIGASTRQVLRAHPDQLELIAIAALADQAGLAAIAREFTSVRHVALYDETAAAAARAGGAFNAAPVTLHAGPAGLVNLATLAEADLVLVAVVGTAGLEPALAALEAGKDLALASKEILVMAGRFVLAAAARGGGRLLPVDSEHSAVWQCLEGRPAAEVAKVWLTASGGAFRDWPVERLAHATPADALRHPTWSMGPKITVDSATLANKGLELIEAQCLFGLHADQCEAVLHPPSIVHCLVQFIDGTLLAQLSPPSMTFPIQHALLHPRRCPGVSPSLDLARALTLEFHPADPARYPMLRLAHEVMRAGGPAPTIYNAANEVAVAAFLGDRLPFLAIPWVVEETLATMTLPEPTDLAAVLTIDREARRLATAACATAQR